MGRENQNIRGYNNERSGNCSVSGRSCSLRRGLTNSFRALFSLGSNRRSCSCDTCERERNTERSSDCCD